MYTIDELVKRVKPDYVAINNPKIKGVPTSGSTLVAHYEVEYDEGDGVMLWITIQ